MNLMLARVLQAAGSDAKTSIVQDESRMNWRMTFKIILSASPTGEQLLSMLRASDIIIQTSDAVLAGSQPAEEKQP